MKRISALFVLLAACAEVRFVDDSQHTAKAWVCIPEKDGAGLRCVDKKLYSQWYLEEYKKQHGLQP